MAGDLHCHTKLSDGSLGIEEIVGLAKRRGLTTLAVTDHDTTAGATRAVVIGNRMGVRVIPGVEFSAWDGARERKVHLLCYLCDHPDRLEGICRRIGDGRRAAAQEMIRRVMRYYPITPELVTKCAAGSTNVFKQHIMHALLSTGYTDSLFGPVYEKLFGENGVARVKIEYPDVREMLAAIHEAGGIAVLAHPFIYDSRELLDELIPLGLDGVEVWHPSHSPEQTEQLAALAHNHGLLCTGGSDFHGMYSTSPHPLASTAATDEAVEALLAYKEKQQKAAKAALKG